MRVGPFSNKKVINYIEEHFVPVYLSNEDYKSGKFGAEERELLRSIRRTAQKNKQRAGSVQVYLVTAELDVADVLQVSEAAQVRKLMPFLQENVTRLGTPSGKRLIEPQSQTKPPHVDPDQLVIRIAAEYKPRQKIMVQDWVVLDKDEWQTFIPPADSDTHKWAIDEEVARKLLVYLYPYAQNWDHSLDQISLAELTAEVLERKQGTTVISLRGSLEMTHDVYVRSGRSAVTSELIGFAVLDNNRKPQITMITGDAQFAGRSFVGLLQSVQ